MSFAKYQEDNLEIMEDRIRTRGAKHIPTVRTVVNIAITTQETPMKKVKLPSNPILLWRECKLCGEVFPMTQKNVEWFFRKGLYLPKHCEKCRMIRKAIQRKEM